MLSALTVAAGGLYTASSKLAVTSGNIANVESAGYRARRVNQTDAAPAGVRVDSVQLSDAALGFDADGQPASNVDLVQESVNLLRAKHQYTASAKLLKTGDQMLGTLLDVMAE